MIYINIKLEFVNELQHCYTSESIEKQAMKRNTYHARNQEMGHTMKKSSKAQIMLYRMLDEDMV